LMKSMGKFWKKTWKKNPKDHRIFWENSELFVGVVQWEVMWMPVGVSFLYKWICSWIP
jgi:hypothetical protein